MKLQEYLRLRSDPGVLDYISVYATYSGEQLRTIGPLFLHIHIENLKKFLVKNQLSDFKIIWQQLSLSRRHGHPSGWKRPSTTEPQIRFLYSDAVV